MKIASQLLTCLFLWSCSGDQVEEFAFRKTLELSLVDLCGEEDMECIAAVKEQVGDCMKKSNWRTYLENEESEDEVRRFTRIFYSCIVDQDGNPYFEPNV